MPVSLTEEELENASAMALGKLLIAFSRLETNLALYLVWASDGIALEALTKKLEDIPLNGKFEMLKDFVAKKYAEIPEARAQFDKWLGDASDTRKIRNELVHGRWGTITLKQQVANVIGIPTSPRQREVRYSLAELEGVVASVQALATGLDDLRNRWPL